MLTGNGDGRFLPNAILGLSGGGLAATDVDGDGDPDLLGAGVGRLSVALNLSTPSPTCTITGTARPDRLVGGAGNGTLLGGGTVVDRLTGGAGPTTAAPRSKTSAVAAPDREGRWSPPSAGCVADPLPAVRPAQDPLSSTTRRSEGAANVVPWSGSFT